MDYWKASYTLPCEIGNRTEICLAYNNGIHLHARISCLGHKNYWPMVWYDPCVCVYMWIWTLDNRVKKLSEDTLRFCLSIYKHIYIHIYLRYKYTHMFGKIYIRTRTWNQNKNKRKISRFFIFILFLFISLHSFSYSYFASGRASALVQRFLRVNEGVMDTWMGPVSCPETGSSLFIFIYLFISFLHIVLYIYFVVFYKLFFFSHLIFSNHSFPSPILFNRLT